MRSEIVSTHLFNSGGFDNLIELSETTYKGSDIADPHYLNWEYNLNPDGDALISIGEINEKVAAQYVVIPRMYSINNFSCLGSLSVNTLTHPDFRRQGLFPRLAEETFTACRKINIQFTIGFPNPLSLPVIRKNNIFEVSGHLPLLFKPLRPLGTVFRYIKGKKKKSGNEIELDVPNKIFKDSNVSILNFSTDQSKYEQFIRLFYAEKQNATIRSWEFLKWRYLNIPRRKYHLLKLTLDNEIKAFVIFRTKFIYGIRCLILVDFISNEKCKHSSTLLKVVNDLACKNHIDLIITTISSQSFEYKILKKEGYFTMPKKFLPQSLPFIVQKHLPNCPDQITDFKKWFLTFGDYDIF